MDKTEKKKKKKTEFILVQLWHTHAYSILQQEQTLSILFCTVQLPRSQFPAGPLKGHIM